MPQAAFPSHGALACVYTHICIICVGKNIRQTLFTASGSFAAKYLFSEESAANQFLLSVESRGEKNQSSWIPVSEIFNIF